jgi:hypothetical protein
MISKRKILLHRYSKVKSPSTSTKQEEKQFQYEPIPQSICNQYIMKRKRNEGNIIETSYSQN